MSKMINKGGLRKCMRDHVKLYSSQVIYDKVESTQIGANSKEKKKKFISTVNKIDKRVL